MLFFNSAENVLKLQASFNTFCLGKLEGSQLTCEIHSGVLGLRWTWMLYRSGCRPASRSIYCGRNSGLQSRQAWLAQEETAQPGTRRDYPHTHSLFFTLYYSLSLWAEAKMSGQGKRGEKKRGETTWKLITGTQCCTHAVLLSWRQDLRKMKRSFEGFFFSLMLKIPLIYLLETERHIRYFAYLLHVVNCTNVRLTNQYRSRIFFQIMPVGPEKARKKKITPAISLKWHIKPKLLSSLRIHLQVINNKKLALTV